MEYASLRMPCVNTFLFYFSLRLLFASLMFQAFGLSMLRISHRWCVPPWVMLIIMCQYLVLVSIGSVYRVVYNLVQVLCLLYVQLCMLISRGVLAYTCIGSLACIYSHPKKQAKRIRPTAINYK